MKFDIYSLGDDEKLMKWQLLALHRPRPICNKLVII